LDDPRFGGNIAPAIRVKSRCKATQIVDCGEALWKILSDANSDPAD
jgi:hypothetical protein